MGAFMEGITVRIADWWCVVRADRCNAILICTWCLLVAIVIGQSLVIDKQRRMIGRTLDAATEAVRLMQEFHAMAEALATREAAAQRTLERTNHDLAVCVADDIAVRSRGR